MKRWWLDLRAALEADGLRAMVLHRQPASEIAQFAVLTGAVAVVGIGVVLAFLNGLGTFFTNLLARINGMLT